MLNLPFALTAIVVATWAAPGAIRENATRTQPDESTPQRIVVLGDSITKGVRTGVAADETFAAYLMADLTAAGHNVEVVNLGIGGERSDQALARLARDVISLKPAVVTIMYGTNDSYVDPGAKSSRLSPEEYGRHLRSIVSELRDAGIQPVLMTEPCYGVSATANGIGEHPNLRLQIFMDVCRDVARETETPLIDHFAHWKTQNEFGTDVGTWTTDQCHPNPSGHRRLADTMLPTLKKLPSLSH